MTIRETDLTNRQQRIVLPKRDRRFFVYPTMGGDGVGYLTGSGAEDGTESFRSIGLNPDEASKLCDELNEVLGYTEERGWFFNV